MNTDESATFTFDVNLLLKEIAEARSKSQSGVSIISKAFNACRRSFHIKLDIGKTDKSVSIWLVERGQPISSLMSEFD